MIGHFTRTNSGRANSTRMALPSIRISTDTNQIFLGKRAAEGKGKQNVSPLSASRALVASSSVANETNPYPVRQILTHQMFFLCDYGPSFMTHVCFLWRADRGQSMPPLLILQEQTLCASQLIVRLRRPLTVEHKVLSKGLVGCARTQIGYVKPVTWRCFVLVKVYDA